MQCPPPTTIPTSFPTPPPNYYPNHNPNINQNSTPQNSHIPYKDFRNHTVKSPPDMTYQIQMLMKTVNSLQTEMRNISKDVREIKGNQS